MKPFINKILFIILAVLFTFVFTGCNHASSSNPPVDNIVYLKKLTSISEISSKKSNIEKIVFSMDSYTGAATPIACADNSTNPAIPTDYFKGVLTDGTTAGQYILTIYGNGHRIYAPENCQGFFSGFSKVTSIEFNNFYTSKVTDMSAMFASCKAFTSLDLSSFDTSKVTNMQNMFQTCTNLSSLNISSFTTSAVTSMAYMFNGCNALKSLNLSKFDTSSVNQMNSMFSSCYELEELDLSNFDTSSVTNMESMFKCTNSTSKLKKIIFSNKFTTAKVTTISAMFQNCCSLTSLDLSSFSSEGLTLVDGTNEILSGSVNNIFSGCSSLTTIYATSKFDLSNSEKAASGIFTSDTKLVGGAGTAYDDDTNVGADYAHIDGGQSNPGYFTLKQ